MTDAKWMVKSISHFQGHVIYSALGRGRWDCCHSVPSGFSLGIAIRVLKIECLNLATFVAISVSSFTRTGMLFWVEGCPKSHFTKQADFHDPSPAPSFAFFMFTSLIKNKRNYILNNSRIFFHTCIIIMKTFTKYRSPLAKTQPSL